MLRFGMTALAALAALAGVAALGIAPAQAALTIRVTQGGGPVLTVTDNGVGDDDPTVDSIKVAATGANSITGTFAILDAGSSLDAQFSAIGNTAQLDNTTRLTLLAGTSGTFTVEASRDGITSPAATSKTVEASGSGNFNRGTSNQQFVLGADAANALFAITTPVATTGVFNSPTAFGFGPVALGFNDPNPYSLTNRANYSITAPSGTTGTVQSTNSQFVTANAVPAPAGLALALAAVPALGLRRLARRKA